jgi:hypothetical protein
MCLENFAGSSNSPCHPSTFRVEACQQTTAGQPLGQDRPSLSLWAAAGRVYHLAGQATRCWQVHSTSSKVLTHQACVRRTQALLGS